MRILLTGGTGLIGQALCQYWQRQGHELWVWSREPNKVAQLCSGAHGISSLQELQETPLDAVINLAGAPIADRPWTAARKQVLWSSRIDLTRTLVDWMKQQPLPPRVLISGSAVGWYGDGAEALLNESSPAGAALPERQISAASYVLLGSKKPSAPISSEFVWCCCAQHQC